MDSTMLNGILTDGGKAATNVANSWNKTWADVLGITATPNTLYGVLCWLGILFALLTLIFLILELYRDLSDGKNNSLSVLIWPVIVMFLLINQGSELAQITLGMREMVNFTSSKILTITVNGAQLNNLYQQANGNMILQALVSQSFSSCKSLSGEAQAKCLDQSVKQSQTYIDSYNNLFPAASWISNIQGFLTTVGNMIVNDPKNPGYGIFGLLKPVWMPIVVSILFLMQIAYQNILEATLLITALFGPIAVGGSLSPYGPKPIFAWLTGFFAVGFGHICFNLIIGLTAAVASQSEGGDPAWFALVTGLFAPILASSLAAGGGLIVWSSLNTAVSNSLQAAIKLVIGII